MSANLHVVGGRGAETPATQASALLALLGKGARGAHQSQSGVDLYADRFDITAADLEAHFRGEVGVGVLASVDGRTGFWFGIDCDARWKQRTACYAKALKHRRLDTAAVFTTGSRASDSGKVIVFFKRALPLEDLWRLSREIGQAARRDPAFGHVADPRHEIELWPKRGDGGILRMGGRHQTRGLRIEQLFDADGAVLDLRTIRPSTMYAVPGSTEPTPIRKAGMQRFVRKWLDYGMPDQILDAGHRRINAAIMRLGFEAYRLNGDAGAQLLKTWLLDITNGTERLAKWQSPTTGDRRNPLDWKTSGSGAWARVCKDRAARAGGGTLHTSPPVGVCNVPLPGAAERIESLLREAVRARGLHPAAFETSYREIASWLGEPNVRHVWRIVQRAVKAGRITIVHRGTRGEKGLKTIFSIPDASVSTAAMKARADRVLGARERRMIEHARAKWAAAHDQERDPVARRSAKTVLARQVVVLPTAPVEATTTESLPVVIDPEVGNVGEVDLMAYARRVIGVMPSSQSSPSKAASVRPTTRRRYTRTTAHGGAES